MRVLIETMTTGKIVLRVDDRRFEFQIEVLVPGPGLPDLVIYTSDLVELSSDGARIDVSHSEGAEVLNALEEELSSRGTNYEVEL